MTSIKQLEKERAPYFKTAPNGPEKYNYLRHKDLVDRCREQGNYTPWGWLDRKGHYAACDIGRHDALLSEYLDITTEYAEKAGWIRISAYGLHGGGSDQIRDGDFMIQYRYHKEPSKAQIRQLERWQLFAAVNELLNRSK